MVSSRRAPDDVAPAGRVAGLTVGACLLVSGLAFLVASWDELTCTPPGATCDDVAGTGGAVSLAALAAMVVGGAIVVLTARRPVVASGSTAWTWGLGTDLRDRGRTGRAATARALLPRRRAPHTHLQHMRRRRPAVRRHELGMAQACAVRARSRGWCDGDEVAPRVSGSPRRSPPSHGSPARAGCSTTR